MFGEIVRIGLVILCLLPVAAAASPPSIAVFPLQELNRGRNEVNLHFTKVLAEHLAANGNEVHSQKAVVSFMASNRIRTVGHLETFHISRVRDELGAAFILLGTISQLKERRSSLSMGLTLHLVRTSDARTVWSHVGHCSAADVRRVLGIGEPKTIAELEPFLLDDIVANWPWEIIGEMQGAASISIDSIELQPHHLRPGAEVSARVRLRNDWPTGRAPRVFIKADEQVHSASLAADGKTYTATWIAGDKDGRFTVSLLLEWPIYGRTENALLGTYLVDGTPPLLELELRGTQLHSGIPVFRKELLIVPQLLVRKPLSRWRLSFLDVVGNLVGAEEGRGNLPEYFLWQGQGSDGPVSDGEYQIALEIWDEAGNTAGISRQVEINRSSPEVALTVEKNGRQMMVELEHEGKIPLAFWRMEMWTKEGRLINATEGSDLPARIGVELTEAQEEQPIEAFLTVQDVMGNRSRRKSGDLALEFGRKSAAVVEKDAPAPFSETWVEEF